MGAAEGQRGARGLYRLCVFHAEAINHRVFCRCVSRQGRAPVLEMAMVAKLLMILIDTPMMWDV